MRPARGDTLLTPTEREDRAAERALRNILGRGPLKLHNRYQDLQDEDEEQGPKQSFPIGESIGRRAERCSWRSKIVKTNAERSAVLM